MFGTALTEIALAEIPSSATPACSFQSNAFQQNAFQPCPSIPPELIVPQGGGKRDRGKASNKPFQPIWDKRRQEELQAEQPPVAPAPVPIPALPKGLFQGFAPGQFPSLDHVLPPNAAEFGSKMWEALDAADAKLAAESHARAEAHRQRTETDARDLHDMISVIREQQDIADAVAVLQAIIANGGKLQ